MGQIRDDSARGAKGASGGRRRALKAIAGMAGAAVLAQASASRTDAQGPITATDVEFSGVIKNNAGTPLMDQNGCYLAYYAP
jgi:hypothetical protein